MESLRCPAELQHVTEHCYPPCADSRWDSGQHTERGTHCRWARVVAFVDQGQSATLPRKFVSPTAPRQLCEPGEGLGGGARVSSDCSHPGEDGEHIHCPVSARHRKPNTQCEPGKRRVDCAAARV